MQDCMLQLSPWRSFSPPSPRPRPLQHSVFSTSFLDDNFYLHHDPGVPLVPSEDTSYPFATGLGLFMDSHQFMPLRGSTWKPQHGQQGSRIQDSDDQRSVSSQQHHPTNLMRGTVHHDGMLRVRSLRSKSSRQLTN